MWKYFFDAAFSSWNKGGGIEFLSSAIVKDYQMPANEQRLAD